MADLQITTLKSKRAIPTVQSAKQRRIYHPLVHRRVRVPFASAPCAPGVQGNAPAALFPRFLSRQRNRAAGGNPSGEMEHLAGEATRDMKSSSGQIEIGPPEATRKERNASPAKHSPGPPQEQCPYTKTAPGPKTGGGAYMMGSGESLTA